MYICLLPDAENAVCTGMEGSSEPAQSPEDTPEVRSPTHMSHQPCLRHANHDFLPFSACLQPHAYLQSTLINSVTW